MGATVPVDVPTAAANSRAPKASLAACPAIAYHSSHTQGADAARHAARSCTSVVATASIMGYVMKVLPVCATAAPSAVAELAPAQGTTAQDTVTFAPGGASAGGHLNPQGKPHRDPAAADHHGGDLQVPKADAAGNATLTVEIGCVTIGSSAGDIVGRSVIVR